MPEIILRTENLGKQFRSRWATQNINLEVHRGDVFGFLGPNGAGKSTTIRMIYSLIRPSTGFVEIFGYRVDKQRKLALQKVAGIVERPDFYLYLSAYRNMQIAGSLTLGKSPEKKKILETLEIVGLQSRADDKVKTFSHGMKQRLGIAQALLCDPELIVLDEPTNGLDPQGMKDVRELIKKLAREKKMTIFLSSHILSEVEQVATRMAIINNGSIISQGKVSDLLGFKNLKIEIEATPIQKVKSILKKNKNIKDIEIVKNKIHAKTANSEIPKLTEELIKNKCKIFSISKNNSLEEYFLSITQK